ncbi:MAG TPA: potassium channel family protein [Gemmatirosa sp.]
MTRTSAWRGWGSDASLSTLLVMQVLTLFVVVPLGAGHPSGRMLHSACDLAFAAVSAVALTRHRAVRGALLGALALLLVATSSVARPWGARVGLDAGVEHEIVALVALAFNALVTALVARRVFGPGRVTAHRVQGAVLLYLNVAALFAILYGVLDAHAPGAFASAGNATMDSRPGMRPATLTYFSLVTITTTGYGDLAPLHPLARSLANLEAVFGQLFPATLLARLVALHLAQHEPAPVSARTGAGDARPS